MRIKEDIVLEIVNKDILDQQVDVIVNPVDPELTF
jgi:O-acetyl-ADP-ribose deacetylase (regulator of RNase III)